MCVDFGLAGFGFDDDDCGCCLTTVVCLDASPPFVDRFLPESGAFNLWMSTPIVVVPLCGFELKCSDCDSSIRPRLCVVCDSSVV
jgi:hypothetical protein